MILGTPIRTPHLLLRTLLAEDANGPYLEWMNDPESTLYLKLGHDKHDVTSIARYIDAANKAKSELLLGIVTLESNTHIGNIKLGDLDHFEKRCNVGLLIGDKSQRGKGYASEAIEGACQYARAGLKLRRIYACTHAPNIGSSKAFLAAGFSEEGLLRGHGRIGDEWHDAIFFGRNF